jgi:hypothetical protein
MMLQTSLSSTIYLSITLTLKIRESCLIELCAMSLVVQMQRFVKSLKNGSAGPPKMVQPFILSSSVSYLRVSSS